jgi:hypothetical protein
MGIQGWTFPEGSIGIRHILPSPNTKGGSASRIQWSADLLAGAPDFRDDRCEIPQHARWEGAYPTLVRLRIKSSLSRGLAVVLQDQHGRLHFIMPNGYEATTRGNGSLAAFRRAGADLVRPGRSRPERSSRDKESASDGGDSLLHRWFP